jgi:plasmid stabilization system protein ParE
MPNSKYTVEVFPLAQQDLESIYEYYFAESQEREVALKVTGKLKEAILGLSHVPASHPQARERRLRADGFRKLICGEYVIPFLIDEDKKAVSVVRIFHGKMNYQKYL